MLSGDRLAGEGRLRRPHRPARCALVHSCCLGKGHPGIQASRAGVLGIAPRSGRVLPVIVVAEIVMAGRVCGASEPAASSPKKARRPTAQLRWARILATI